MSAFDRNYLQNDQYKNASNLTSRINLHKAFSTNPYGWFRWVFDQLELLPAQASLLEFACGRGDLWRENASRIPAGWDLTLTDLSRGMLADARSQLAPSPSSTGFCAADIEAPPFPSARFDAVIANHVLFYVADKPRAFGEILRLLKPGGWFFATTVGARHMGELTQLTGQFEGLESALFNSSELDFILENGSGQLAPFFENIQIRRYEDSLFITQAEPLVQFIYSGHYPEGLKGSPEPLHAFLDQRIRTEGGISVFKDSGIFIAQKGG